jgi:hypothetical protein
MKQASVAIQADTINDIPRHRDKRIEEGFAVCLVEIVCIADGSIAIPPGGQLAALHLVDLTR